MPTVAELSIEVNLKDTGTQAEILRLQQMLQQLATEDPDISVRVSAAAAKKEFDDLQDRILVLEAESVNIETDVDAAIAIAQLEELQRSMRNLDRSTVNVDVDIDTAGALAHIAALKVALEAIKKEKIDVDPDKKNTKTLNQISAAAQRASGTIRGLTTAIIALGPALVPLSALLLTAILGITAGLAAAGAGATLFGFVAVSAFTPIVDVIKKMNTAQDQYNQAVTAKQKETALLKLKALFDSLDPSQQKVVTGYMRLRDAWNAFVEKFRPEIFTIGAEAMNAFADVLPHLEPLMANATKAIHQLQTESIAAFKNPVWQEFFQNITNSAEPAILALGHSIGNLVTGFAGVLNAFFPFSDGLLGGLERLTKKFADWGAGLENNPGFKAFVAYVRENTPAVIQFLKSLGKAFVDLVIAAAPVGTQILGVLTSIFNGFSKLTDINPIIGSVILAFLGLGAIFVNLIGPILAIANIINLLRPIIAILGTGIEIASGAVFSFLAAWGLLVAAIAIVIAALVLAYQHFDSFRGSVDALWQKLVEVGRAILDAVKPALDEVIQFFQDEWQKFISWWSEHTETFSAAWDNIKSWTDSALTYIVNLISNALSVIEGIWNSVWPGLSRILSGVWDIISGVISGAFQIIRGIFTVFAAIIAGDWGAIWDGLGDIVFGAIQIVVGVIGGAVQIIVGVLQVLWGAVQAIWDLIVNAFVSGAQNAGNFLVSTWNGIVSLLSGAWDGIVSGAQNFVNVIVGFFQWLYDVLIGNSIIPDMINGIIEWWNSLVAFLSAVMQPVVDIVVAAFQLISTTVTTVVQAVVDFVVTAWNLLMTVTAAIFNAVVTVISTAITTAQTIITTILNAISATWLAIWNLIVTVAEQVWNVIKSVVQGAIDAVKAVISATLSVIKGNWSEAWNTIKSAASSIWDSIKSAISTAIDTVKSKVSSTLDTIKSIWKAAWDTVLSALKTAATNVLDAVTGLASDIFNAFVKLPGQLLDIGKRMMSQLADGIKSAGGAVVGAVGGIIKKATGALPGSPADWGPLSGQGYVKLRGQRFMDDLTDSLKNTSGLQMTMRDIADIMTLDANPSQAYNAITSSVAGAFSQLPTGGSTQNVNIQPGAVVLQLAAGADPEAARRAFENSADTLGEALLTAIQKR